MVANVRGRVTLADQAKGQVILQTEAQFPTVLRIGHESKIYINENKIIPKPEADRPIPMRRCLVEVARALITSSEIITEP